jgi:hypothetical protein
MSCYRVTFFKNLLSSDGHPFKCIQRAIDIRHARDADRAVEAAELRYERLHRVHDWTLYADFLELEVDGKKVDYCPPEMELMSVPARLSATSMLFVTGDTRPPVFFAGP